MTGLIKRTHFLKFRSQFNAGGIQDGHRIQEVKPTPGAVVNRVARIPWGWINKKIYDPDVLPGRIRDQKMRLFDLIDAGRPVGYSIIVDPDQGIKDSFLKSVVDMRPIEIENIALFPNQAGQGRGRSFLNLVSGKLFDDGHNPIYLNTSETNFPTLPAFYRRMGMIDLGQDSVPDFNHRPRQFERALVNTIAG